MTSRTPYIPTVLVDGQPQLDFLKSQYIGLAFANLDYTLYTLTSADAGCPDLISYRAYGDESYYWIILFFNGIVNPYLELTTGLQLRIPTLNQALSYIKNNTYIQSAQSANQVVTI